MPFDINEFISEINSTGVVVPAYFDVMIFGPNIDDESSTERSIMMRCMETELPGRQIQTVDHSHYGPQRMMPTNTNFSELTLRLLLDEDHNVREYLERWMDKISGNFRNSNPNPNMFDLGFYDDYVGTIEIHQYNELGETKHTTQLIEVYPKTIAEESLSWSSGNEFITLPVTFVFRYYKNL